MKAKMKSLAQILAGCQKWNQNGQYYHIHVNDILKIGFRSYYKSYLDREVDLLIKKNRRGETIDREYLVCGNGGQGIFTVHATWIDHFIVEPAPEHPFAERLPFESFEKEKFFSPEGDSLPTSQFIKLTGIEIFKLTPKTNCKACGSTCLQFSMNLLNRRSQLADCPHLSDEVKYQICGSKIVNEKEKVWEWDTEKDVWTTEEKINITELTWDQLFEV